MPLDRTTELPEGFGSKPVPVVVNVVAPLPMEVVVIVTVGAGTMIAICTGRPLATPLLLSVANRGPVDPGGVPMVSVAVVEVGAGLLATVAVGEPERPESVIALFPAVVLKFVPVMAMDGALMATLAVLAISEGKLLVG